MNFMNGFTSVFNSRELGQMVAISFISGIVIAIIVATVTRVVDRSGIR